MIYKMITNPIEFMKGIYLRHIEMILRRIRAIIACIYDEHQKYM